MAEGQLKGAKASKRDPKILQLLFADDNIIFEEATDQGVILLKDTLLEYE